MPPSRIATLLRLFQQTPPPGVADNEQVGNALLQLAQNIRPTGAKNSLEEFAQLPGHALANSIEGAGALIQPEKIVQGIKGIARDPQPAIDAVKDFASEVSERPLALLEQLSLSDAVPGLTAGKFLGAASAVAGAVPPGGNKFLEKLGKADRERNLDNFLTPRQARLAELAEGVENPGALERGRLEGGDITQRTASISKLENLDPVEKARLDRAVQQGFTLDAFHGTKGDILSFDPGLLGATTGAPSARKAFFFSAEPETAGNYARSANLAQLNLPLYDKIIGERDAVQRELRDVRRQMTHVDEDIDDGAMLDALSKKAEDLTEKVEDLTKGMNDAGQNILPVKLRLQNPLVHDFGGTSYREVSYHDLLEQAQRAGHDGVIFKNTRDGGPITDIYAVFEPSQVRSRFAAFDPEDAPTGGNSGRELAALDREIKTTQVFIDELESSIKRGVKVEEGSLQDEVDALTDRLNRLQSNRGALEALAQRAGDITATMPPILFPLGAGTAAVAYSANQESD